MILSTMPRFSLSESWKTSGFYCHGCQIYYVAHYPNHNEEENLDEIEATGDPFFMINCLTNSKSNPAGMIAGNPGP